ncbi:MAG: hypothetical protein JO227_23325 [Acetobacteraceae bacterium]|nr:hypothetical protein [Acetobacteraceae bacterium]
MIIVIEGISASGKTTWCHSQGAQHVVPETGRIEDAPDRAANPAAAARFWANLNAERWKSALAVEWETGTAICDTDPLKLHYIWCLWQIGEASEEHWGQQLAVFRQAFAEKRLGFADAYFVKVIDPVIARQQRESDTSRTRRNFELHVRLQPPLIAWYQALAAAIPAHVAFGLPDRLTAPPASEWLNKTRYDVFLFDKAIANLPRCRTF